MKKDYQKPCVSSNAKTIYRSISAEKDPDGFALFRAAEEILGAFACADFPYEDNCGYFEEADGNKLLNYLLVQHCDKLGDSNSNRSRWKIACPGYEKCVDLSIDETTPEYQAFEYKLYVRVLERLGILEPAAKQGEEVAL